MPVDPSIPLQAGKTGPDPLESAARIFTIKAAMQQAQLGDYELHDQLTLRDASSDPRAKNPDGTLNATSLLSLVTGKISPKTQLTLSDAAQKQQVFQQQQEDRKRKVTEEFFTKGGQIAAGIMAKYEPLEKQYGPEKAGELVQDDIESMRQQLQQITGIQMPPHRGIDSVRQFAMHSENYVKSQQRASQPSSPHEKAMEDAANRRAKAAEEAAAKKPDASKGGLSGYSEEEKDKLARDAMKDKSILTNIGRGTQGRQDILDITRRMTRIMLAEGTSTAEQRAQFRADSNSLVQLTKKSDAIESNLKSFHNNLDTWDSLAKGQLPKLGGERVKALEGQLQKINFTGIQSLDDWKLKIQQQVNDPTANALLVAAMAAGMDYARIMSSQGQSAAQVTEGARNEALRLLKAGADEKGRAGIMAAMESDTEGQRKGIQDQRQQIIDRMTGSGKKEAPKSDKKRRPLSDFSGG